MRISEIKRTARKEANDLMNSFVGHFNGDEETPAMTEYVGSVLHMSPSGKYYTPFANSNVDSCVYCKGSGISKQYDDCNICHGTGERTFEEIKKYGWTKEKFISSNKSHVPFLDENHFECFACYGKGIVYRQCSYCGGIGSREAYQDEIFWDAFDETLAEKNFWRESGEGDQLDVFIGRSMTEEEMRKHEIYCFVSCMKLPNSNL